MSGHSVLELVAALDREIAVSTALRHRLHASPDLSGKEGPTRDLVLEYLPAPHGVTKVADTGALIRVGPPGPAIAVRAELDALPVLENTTANWHSKRPGIMHACGHDIHLAALTALARALNDVGGPAPLLAVLQPREESFPSGALEVVESGTLTEEQCRSAIGVHVQPTLPAGHVACTPGIVNASSDEVTLLISGAGGHAAYPHLSTDPVLTLAHVVVALQSHVSRAVDPMSSVVLSVTMLEAGTAANVIPGHALARGTIRAMNSADRARAIERVTEITDLVARAHGCESTVTVTPGEPPLDNNPELARGTGDVLRRLDLQVADSLRSAGSDDFSYYSEALPSLMMFVGTGEPEERLHSPSFLPADARIRDVALAMLAGYIAASEAFC
jgi:amidohydrolase